MRQANTSETLYNWLVVVVVFRMFLSLSLLPVGFVLSVFYRLSRVGGEHTIFVVNAQKRPGYLAGEIPLVFYTTCWINCREYNVVGFFVPFGMQGVFGSAPISVHRYSRG